MDPALWHDQDGAHYMYFEDYGVVNCNATAQQSTRMCGVTPRRRTGSLPKVVRLREDMLEFAENRATW